MKEIISSLDIGSNTVKLVVGEYYKDEVHILATSCVKSKGVKKGLIVNPEETLISLKEAFSRCEEMLNTKIKKVLLIVPSYFTEFIKCEGYTTITNEEGKVTAYDMVRSMQSCVYNKVPSNKELVSIMPVEFLLDDKTKVKNPLGKEANKLTCRSIVSLVPKKNVYTAFSVLDSMGVEITDLCLGGLADYYEFKSKENETGLGAVINIGHEKTEVSIINDKILVDTEVLEIGGLNIDKDICYMYNVSKKDACNLKETFALAHKRNASSSWNEELLTNEGENIKINQYEISDIVNSRIKEILDLSKKQINLLTKKVISYIIIVGGTTEVRDFSLVVEEIFGKDIKPCKMNEIGCRHNKYSTVIGTIKYFHDKLSFRGRLAYTMDENNQNEIANIKSKNSNILEKIHGYFFE